MTKNTKKRKSTKNEKIYQKWENSEKLEKNH